MFKAVKKLGDKQLELEGKQSALESEVNRVKGTLNDIKGDLSLRWGTCYRNTLKAWVYYLCEVGEDRIASEEKHAEI